MRTKTTISRSKKRYKSKLVDFSSFWFNIILFGCRLVFCGPFSLICPSAETHLNARVTQNWIYWTPSMEKVATNCASTDFIKFAIRHCAHNKTKFYFSIRIGIKTCIIAHYYSLVACFCLHVHVFFCHFYATDFHSCTVCTVQQATFIHARMAFSIWICTSWCDLICIYLHSTYSEKASKIDFKLELMKIKRRNEKKKEKKLGKLE